MTRLASESTEKEDEPAGNNSTKLQSRFASAKSFLLEHVTQANVVPSEVELQEKRQALLLVAACTRLMTSHGNIQISQLFDAARSISSFCCFVIISSHAARFVPFAGPSVQTFPRRLGFSIIKLFALLFCKFLLAATSLLPSKTLLLIILLQYPFLLHHPALFPHSIFIVSSPHSLSICGDTLATPSKCYSTNSPLLSSSSFFSISSSLFSCLSGPI